MSRLGSDVRAVAAILVGAAAGVAGTVMTVRAVDGRSSEAVPCVELGAPRVVYVREGQRTSVTLAPTPPVRTSATCADRRVSPAVTIIRPDAERSARVRVFRFQAEGARSEAERARSEAERARRQADELRRRAEQLRRQAEEVRVQAERMRARARGLGPGGVDEARDVERARREALARAERLRTEYEATLERYREAIASAGDRAEGGVSRSHSPSR